MRTARLLVAVEDHRAVLEECDAVDLACIAASREAFALQLERLALHYPENRLSREEQGALLKDWRRLLGDLPLDLLAEAVDAYLLSPARFFPTPGQLLGLVRDKWEYRQLLARRAQDVRELIVGGAQ